MISGALRRVVNFEFFGMVKRRKSWTLLLLESGNGRELTDIIEHDAEIMIERG